MKNSVYNITQPILLVTIITVITTSLFSVTSNIMKNIEINTIVKQNKIENNEHETK